MLLRCREQGVRDAKTCVMPAKNLTKNSLLYYHHDLPEKYFSYRKILIPLPKEGEITDIRLETVEGKNET